MVLRPRKLSEKYQMMMFLENLEHPFIGDYVGEETQESDIETLPAIFVVTHYDGMRDSTIAEEQQSTATVLTVNPPSQKIVDTSCEVVECNKDADDAKERRRRARNKKAHIRRQMRRKFRRNHIIENSKST